MSALVNTIAKSIERDPFFGWLMAVTVLGSVGGSLAGILDDYLAGAA